MLYIEGYEEKVILLKKVNTIGTMEFYKELDAAYQEGFRYIDTKEIAPDGFNHMKASPTFWNKPRVVLYKKLIPSSFFIFYVLLLLLYFFTNGLL